MSEYRIDLKGGRHAVLLIHGLTGSPFELKPLAKRLHKAGFTVKAPCLTGHCETIESLKITVWRDWYGTIYEAFSEMKKEYKTVSAAGLCMGALLCLQLAGEVGDEVSSIALLSTTLFYDGWSLPWYKFLLPVSYLPPFRFFYSYREREPYGIKDSRMRERISRMLQEDTVAYSSFPSESMHELFKLIRSVKKILPQVKVPTIILHAEEDDLASLRNAEYVEQHIGASEVRKIIIPDSYHMLTLDNQKELVANETVRFFRERVIEV